MFCLPKTAWPSDLVDRRKRGLEPDFSKGGTGVQAEKLERVGSLIPGKPIRAADRRRAGNRLVLCISTETRQRRNQKWNRPMKEAERRDKMSASSGKDTWSGQDP